MTLNYLYMEGEPDRRAGAVLKTAGTVLSRMDFDYTRPPPIKLCARLTG